MNRRQSLRRDQEDERCERTKGILIFTVAVASFLLLLDPFGLLYPLKVRRTEDAEPIYIYKTTWEPSETLINVHLIPHTHDDAGWQVSVDEYQNSQVDVILDNVFVQLEQNPDRRFTYAETNFFASWYRRQTATVQARVRKLVDQGRLEIVNGGWVQHDEAGPLYTEMIDQTTRGHLWMKKTLNVCPSVAWQLDPFGHSNTQAWLMSSKVGMNSIFFGRSDYRELNMRYANASLEYLWQSSKSFGPSTRIFASQLYGQGRYGGYYSWYPFEETNARDRNYVQDDPTMQDYNVQEWIERIITAAQNQASQTQTNHQLWMLGNDFTFQSASRWYSNYDKLIHYVNRDGRIRIFYSTPGNYVKFKFAAFPSAEWETRKSDMFPLADGPHEYWTGYFTSRPSLKRQFRYSSGFLTAARQVESLIKLRFPKTNVDKLNDTTLRTPTSPLGRGWTDDLEGALGIVAHHDGVSGTARQSVTNDYAFRLALGASRAEYGVLKSLESVAGIAPGGNFGFCNCNSEGPKDCLNATTCSFTSTRKSFTVVVWNPLGRHRMRLIEVPVRGALYKVTREDGMHETSATFVEIDPTTRMLPLLYLNDYKLSPSEIWTEAHKLDNPATHRLIFPVEVPPLGYSVYRITSLVGGESTSDDEDPSTTAKNVLPLVVEEGKSEKERALSELRPLVAESISNEDTPLDEEVSPGDKITAEEEPSAIPLPPWFHIENDVYKVQLDIHTKKIVAIVNKRLKKRFPFEIEWGYYVSSLGGCSKERPDPDFCNSQASGAYLFRPNATDLDWKTVLPTSTTIRKLGSLGMELTQHFNEWISHTIRLVDYSSTIQVEWTVGPIPIDDDTGKEIVVRYSTKRAIRSSKTFYTDSNGREMIERVRNFRSKDFCEGKECVKSLKYEPISSNYYPVNSVISINDDDHELDVLVDATHGGTSLKDGQVELMVHRRVLKDDYRGVEEPLNETMCGCGDINSAPGRMGVNGRLGDGGCGCVGLAIRGRHLLVLDEVPQARRTRRVVATHLANPPQLAFFENEVERVRPNMNSSLLFRSGLELPENVQLITFCSNYENGTLVRFAHLFETDEHQELSVPVRLSLKSLFLNKINSVAEYSLSANQPISKIIEAQKILPWNSPEQGLKSARVESSSSDDFVFDLKPMDVITLWVQFEANK